jgi:hypothetical protein
MFYGGDKMIEFPAATAVHRRLPKEAFYKHLPLTKILKEKFVSDVDRIVVENSFTKENLNLASDAEIKEIMLLSISLKNQEFDYFINLTDGMVPLKSRMEILAYLKQYPDKDFFYVDRSEKDDPDLRKKTEIPFESFRMDLDTLKQYSQYGKKLTETDKKRLEKLGEEKEFSEVIRYMLEKNIKLEQECIIE